MRLTLIFVLLVVAFASGKRSAGRSRGSSSRSKWTRTNSKSEGGSTGSTGTAVAKPVPKETAITKQTSSNQQQSAPQNTKPIGWDPPKQGAQGSPPPYSPAGSPVHAQHYPPAYSAHGVTPPGYSPHGVAPPGYSPHGVAPPGYSPHGVPSPYSPHGVAPPGYSPHGVPSPYSPHGVSPPAYGGYGGYGGHNYPQQNTGMFGGNKYGGYGGFGGYGGYGNYGMKKSSGIFGKHAFRNVLGGLAVMYLVSSLVSTPFRIYSYMNRPPLELRQEINIPANVLTLCSDNATSICAPGTTAICTQTNQILCVTSMTKASACQDNSGELCVNSKVPCIDSSDPLCQNKTSDNTANVNLPCFTNMTLDTNQMVPSNVTLPVSEDNKFCVTTMAVPDPTIPPENATEVPPQETPPSPVPPQFPMYGPPQWPYYYPYYPPMGANQSQMQVPGQMPMVPWYMPPQVPFDGVNQTQMMVNNQTQEQGILDAEVQVPSEIPPEVPPLNTTETE